MQYSFVTVLVLFLAVSAGQVVGAAEIQTAKDVPKITDPLCTPQYRPPFNLFLMDRIEREAALDMLVKGREITFNMPDSGMTEESCVQLLDKLTSGKAKILEPDFTSHGTDEIFQKQENPGHDDSYSLHAGTLTYALEEIAPNCPYLDLSREYDVHGKSRKPLSNARQSMAGRNLYARDLAFLNRPQNEKEKDALYGVYYEATDNMEYYDLSSYFGKPIWGYFAEGAFSSKIHQSPKTGSLEEQRMKPACFSHVSTIQKVFNAETCALAEDDLRLPTRYNNSGHWPPAYNISQHYYMYAFADISGSLYRLNLTRSSFPTMKDFIRGGFILAIDRISIGDSDTPMFHEVCTFSNYILDKDTDNFFRMKEE